jgi:hypothetical protein
MSLGKRKSVDKNWQLLRLMLSFCLLFVASPLSGTAAKDKPQVVKRTMAGFLWLKREAEAFDLTRKQCDLCGCGARTG